MSRKNKKKRAGAPGIDPQERRQRQLEERRRQRAEAEAALMRQRRRERFIRIGLFAVLAAGLFWFLFLRGGAPTEFNGHTVESLSKAGVGQHPADPSTIDYPTIPPVSGPHDQTPEACGVHDQQLEDAKQVHSLEHGAVGIQFDPTLDPTQIAAIEELVRGYSQNVFSAPYEGMPSPISVTAWGYMMRLDEFDSSAVTQFIDQFAGKGPEPEQSCPSTADSSFAPEGASPSPAPSAVPSTSPTGTSSPGQ
jgi:hypothetical protein